MQCKQSESESASQVEHRQATLPLFHDADRPVAFGGASYGSTVCSQPLSSSQCPPRARHFQGRRCY